VGVVVAHINQDMLVLVVQQVQEVVEEGETPTNLQLIRQILTLFQIRGVVVAQQDTDLDLPLLAEQEDLELLLLDIWFNL